jgi:hypothetical protein
LDCKETNYIFAVQLKGGTNCFLTIETNITGLCPLCKYQQKQCGMEQLVARRAHNPKVVGSSPAPATSANKKALKVRTFKAFLFFISRYYHVATFQYTFLGSKLLSNSSG